MAQFRLPPNSVIGQGKTYAAPTGAAKVKRFVVYRDDPSSNGNLQESAREP